MRGIYLICLLTFLVFGTPAQAAPVIDEAGAQELQQSLEKLYNWYSEVAVSAGEGLIMSGGVDVKPNGDFYVAKITGLSIVVDHGYRFDIGTATYHIMPSSTPDVWLVSMTLPPKIVMYDSKDRAEISFHLGEQKSAALWHAKDDLWPKYDVTFNNINIASYDGSFKTAIKELRFTMDLKQDPDGNWSGPSNFTMNGIHLSGQGKNSGLVLKIANIVSNTSYKSLVLNDLETLRTEIKELLGAMQGDTKLQKKVRKLIAKAARNEYSDAQDIVSDLKMKGLTANLIYGKAGVSRRHNIELKNLETSVSALNMRNNTGQIDWSLGMNGFTISDLPPGIDPGLIPHQAQINVNLSNLPITEIAERAGMFIAFIGMGSSKDEADNEAKQFIAVDLPAILAKAGSGLTVKNTFIAAPNISGQANVELSAQAQPPYAAGTARVTLGGIDELITQLRQSGLAQGKDLQGLAGIQIAGQLQQDKNGRSMRIYDFKINPDGTILLNGVDMSMMGKR